ncbi:phage tail spike protein [Lactiplantibacillus plantarum]|uniref:phage tail spike protein n=1 Tax=Lactiplantibacillus plantarum TaxID=1590 RepID=UPI000978175A|nr:phage tail spike protein [Lactiplantibacillus plantarum]
MALDNQYLILDPSLKRVGTLTVDGATKFSNDSILIQLADSDNTSTAYDDDLTISTYDNFTGTIDLNAQSKKFDHQGSLDVLQGQPDSDKVVAGNNLAYYDSLSGHWYVMHIYYTDEANSTAVKHITTAYLTNLCLFTLANHYPLAQTTTDSSIQTVFDECFSGTGWTLDYQTTNTMTPSIEIDGKTKASTLLQTLIQDYGVEVDPYVEIDSQGNITQKVCVVTDQLNSDVVYNEAVFGKNITALKRTTVSVPITKLIAYGAQGATMAAANDGKIYVVDDDANQLYNPDWQAGLYYEGVVTANSINDAVGLKAWAEQLLQLYNHPRVYYEVTVTPNFNPPLGATIRFKDEQIKPVLDATGRVIQRTISFANPYGNVIGFGEYTTVQVATPAWLAGLTSALDDAVSQAKADASTVVPVISHPDGLDFAQGDTSKRLILSAYEGTENISAYIDPLGFDWSRTDTNGLVDTTYAKTGYLNVIPAGTLGNIRGQIDGDYITDDPEISINDTTWAKFGSFDAYDNGVDEVMQHAEQLSDGRWITSQADCTYTLRDASLKYVSKMSVTNGGHGTSFGVTIEDGTIYIFAPLKTSAGYDLVKIPYTAGQTLDTDDVTHLLSFDHYIRVNYDATNDYFGLTDDSLNYYVLQGSDVRNGVDNILYQIALTDYGYDIDTQIYQGQLLDFPYVYFQSGNQNENDTCQIYAINLIHEGECFNYLYDFPDKLALTGYIEPEGLVFATINGTRVLMNCLTSTVGINTTPKTEYFYQVALTTRAPMTANSGTNDDSNDNDREKVN